MAGVLCWVRPTSDQISALLRIYTHWISIAVMHTYKRRHANIGLYKLPILQIINLICYFITSLGCFVVFVDFVYYTTGIRTN